MPLPRRVKGRRKENTIHVEYSTRDWISVIFAPWAGRVASASFLVVNKVGCSYFSRYLTGCMCCKDVHNAVNAYKKTAIVRRMWVILDGFFNKVSAMPFCNVTVNFTGPKDDAVCIRCGIFLQLFFQIAFGLANPPRGCGLAWYNFNLSSGLQGIQDPRCYEKMKKNPRFNSTTFFPSVGGDHVLNREVSQEVVDEGQERGSANGEDLVDGEPKPKKRKTILVSKEKVGKVQIQFFASHSLNVQNFDPNTLFEFGDLTLAKWLEGLPIDVGFNMLCTFFELMNDGLLDATEKLSLVLLYYSAMWMAYLDPGFDAVRTVRDLIPRVVKKYSSKFKRNWSNFNHTKKRRCEIYDVYVMFHGNATTRKRKRTPQRVAPRRQCDDARYFWQFVYHYLGTQGFDLAQKHMEDHGFVVDEEIQWNDIQTATRWWNVHLLQKTCDCFDDIL